MFTESMHLTVSGYYIDSATNSSKLLWEVCILESCSQIQIIKFDINSSSKKPQQLYSATQRPGNQMLQELGGESVFDSEGH